MKNTREDIEEMSGKLAQILVDHGVIPKEKQGMARSYIFFELQKECLEPMANFCSKIEIDKKRMQA